MSDTIHQPDTTLEGSATLEAPPEPETPQRSRRRLLAIGGVLVALAVGVLVLLLTRASGPLMSSEDAESQIQPLLAEAIEGFDTTREVSPADVTVSCPDTLPSEPETTFECDVTVPGVYEPLDGTVVAFITGKGKADYCAVTGDGWSIMRLSAEVCTKGAAD